MPDSFLFNRKVLHITKKEKSTNKSLGKRHNVQNIKHQLIELENIKYQSNL